MTRSRQRAWCGWLGLLALALHLLLSFAHHHDHEAGGATVMASAGSLEPGSAGQSPAVPDDDGDEHCAICWAMAVAACIVLPALVALALTARQATPTPPSPAHALAESRRSGLFQARAPPSPAAA